MIGLKRGGAPLSIRKEKTWAAIAEAYKNMVLELLAINKCLCTSIRVFHVLRVSERKHLQFTFQRNNSFFSLESV